MGGPNRQRGFSVAEVLIAVGILAVAMMLIAGVFPVGIRFTQVSIDRTTAAIAANEAFAKIQLCANVLPGVNNTKLRELDFVQQRDFNDWFDDLNPIMDGYLVDANMFSWPTDGDINFPDKQYCWSALLRRTDAGVIVIDPNDSNILDPRRNVQVTVFVCRRAGPAAKYYRPDFDSFNSLTYGEITPDTGELPSPVRIKVGKVAGGRPDELQIETSEEKTLINDGDLTVDDVTGRIYRVVERYKSLNDNIILLDRGFIWDDWQGGTISSPTFVWVVPPAAPMSSQRGRISNVWQVSGKSPCVAVYQKVIRF